MPLTVRRQCPRGGMAAVSLSSLRSAGFALLIYIGAIAVRMLIDHASPGEWYFATFYPAVALAGYFCGLRWGIAVLALSAMTGAYWGMIGGAEAEQFELLGAFWFILTSGINLALVYQLEMTSSRLVAHDANLTLINRELEHRINNLCAVILSICLQTLKSRKTKDEMIVAIQGRVNAVAAAIGRLSSAATDDADLRDLVMDLVLPVAPDPGRLEMHGPRLRLDAQAATPLALVLHELATNALKHGAWAKAEGQILLHWQAVSGARGRELEFRWRECGGPAVMPPQSEGLGRKLIEHGLGSAEVDYDLREDGLVCTIRLPLTA